MPCAEGELQLCLVQASSPEGRDGHGCQGTCGGIATRKEVKRGVVHSRSLLLGGGVLFWFRDFFSTEDVVPSKLRWVHMCPFSYRKRLSATATFVAVLLLLCWQTTCTKRGK